METTIIKCNYTGSAYKLSNGALMFAPLDKDNIIIESFGEEDWSEVDFDRLSREESLYLKQAIFVLNTAYLLK